MAVAPAPRRLYAYPLNFTASAGFQLPAVGGQSQRVITNPDQITVFTHWGFKSTGAFLVQVTPSDLGGGMFQAPVSSETILALLDRPGQFPVPIVLRGAATLQVDLTNDIGIANDVRLTFFGYREFPGRAAAGGRV